MELELAMFDSAGSKGAGVMKTESAAYELAHGNHFAEWSRELVLSGITTWEVR